MRNTIYRMAMTPDRDFPRSLKAGLRFGVFFAPDRLLEDLMPHLRAFSYAALMLCVAPLAILMTILSFIARTFIILAVAASGRLALIELKRDVHSQAHQLKSH